MSTLFETYEEVYQHVKVITERIARIDESIGRITDRNSLEIPVRIDNLKKQLERIDEYALKIEGYRQLAEKNLTSKNVLRIEAPPGYRVNLNRLRQWAMRIDPMAQEDLSTPDDPYAQRVYAVAQCDLCFLAKKKQEFEARIRELEADQERGANEIVKELEEERRKQQQALQDYVESEEMAQFCRGAKAENEAYIYEDSPYAYADPEETPEYWVPGASGVSLGVEGELQKKLKDSLGGFYDDRAGQIFFPVEKIRSGREFALTVSCVPARSRMNEMDAGIRNLILQIIQQSPACSRKVYIIDALRQNSLLAGSLRQLEGTFALQSIPRNQEQIAAALETLVASFNDMDDILDTCDSVAEYNSGVVREKQLVRSLVVLVGWPGSFEGQAASYIKKIVSNFERYGISLVAVKISTKTDAEFGLSEYIGEDVIHVEMTGSDTRITFGREEPRSFVWYTFKQRLSERYVESIKEHQVESGALGTVYTRRVDMEQIPPYVRGKKSICVPYGVDSQDNVHSISFDNENFASYLMGASGSGKSTLLHTIITGILRDYHPDDVELWLADFKMSEFAQYMDPLPPHVKYILLDESPELVYDLLDQLTERMMERQRFFMDHKDMKKVENVPKDIYMPVIFVILDEFSIMSQSVAESETYKLKLQNLLAKGRALGIKFIFSSQTFTKGIAGLTRTAKDQIQTRIAMKNSYSEINETLEVSSGQRTEQVKNWMEALPPHFALSKYRDGDNVYIKRLQVMYFEGKGDEALAPQRAWIERLNAQMRPVPGEEYLTAGENSYVDKHPVIVDGNSYRSFREERVRKILDDYRREHTFDVAAEDILMTFGTPRRMSEAEVLTISSESRENLLLMARGSEQACAMSLILTAMKSFKLQGGHVRVWAYSKNRLFRAYRDSHFAKWHAATAMEEICREIRELRERIEQRETGNELIVLIGMEQICSDFELIDFGTAGGTGAGRQSGAAAPDMSRFMAKTEEERKKAEEVKETYQSTEEITEKIMMDGLAQGKSRSEIKEEIARALREHMKAKNSEVPSRKQEEKKQAAEENAAKESAEEEKEEKTSDAYNAQEDFRYIVRQGSRFGFHFMLCLNQLADLKNTRLQGELFRHKLVFQLSTEDSRSLLNSRAAAGLPERICLYSNALEQYSLRPFIHEGVNWDGWDLDENQEAVNGLHL